MFIKIHQNFGYEQKKFMELANVNLELAVNGNKIHKIFLIKGGKYEKHT